MDDQDKTEETMTTAGEENRMDDNGDDMVEEEEAAVQAEAMEADDVADDDKGGTSMDTDSSSTMMTDDNGEMASGMNTEEDADGGDEDEVLASPKQPDNDNKDSPDKMPVEDTAEDDDEVMAGDDRGGKGVGEGIIDQIDNKSTKGLMQDDVPAATEKMKDDDNDDDERKESQSSKQPVASSTKTTLNMALHDWLSLGEIERGLNSCRRLLTVGENDGESEKRHDGDDEDDRVRSSEEFERLPYLLRILNQTRPLAGIPSSVGSQSSINPAVSPVVSSSSSVPAWDDKDPLVNRVVDRLEDVAATYSAAEGVDVVVNYLTPALCKKISRLPVPIPKQRRENDIAVDDDNEDMRRLEMPGYKNYYYENEWDTSQLEDVAQDPLLQRGTKRKRLAKGDDDGGLVSSSEVLASEDSDDDQEVGDISEESGTAAAVASCSISKRVRRRDSIEMAGEDSQESTVLKTLSEITSLVASSLRPVDTNHNESAEGKTQRDAEVSGEQPTVSGRDIGSTLSLTIEDSILSETGGGTDENFSSGVKSTTLHGSDLGSTLASIMHYSPVLQSRHVATAICRASLPQTEFLLRRIAANCPATVPSLLLGCIDAYVMALDHGNTSIAKMSKRGVCALAKLSRNEAITVRSKLHALGIMYDVQLRLSMETGDFFEVPAMLIQHLLPLASFEYEKDERSGRQVFVVVPSEESPASKKLGHGTAAETTLLDHFLQTTDLLDATLLCFTKRFQGVKNQHSRSWGCWCLTMQAFCLLLLVPKDVDDSSSISAGMHNLMEWIESERLGTHNSQLSDLTGFVMASSVLLASRMIVGKSGSTELNDLALSLVKRASELGSEESTFELWQCMGQLMTKGCVRGLFRLILSLVAGDDSDFAFEESIIDDPSYRTLQVGLKRLCDGMQAESDDASSAVDLPVKISTFLLMLRDGTEDASVHQDSMDVLKSLVGQKATGLVSESHLLRTAQFVVEATKSLMKAGVLEVPLVMQAELEYSLMKLESSQVVACNDSILYLLQFLHGLVFRKSNPTSPFAIDPYTASIRESILLVERLPSGSAKTFLKLEICELLGKERFAINLRYDNRFFGMQTRNIPLSSKRRGELMKSLMDAIQVVVKGGETEGGEGRNAEWLFVLAKSYLVDVDLYTSVVSAMLTPPTDPFEVFTYNVLCRDPMIVFKAPVAVWRCKSLRRILLSTLGVLLRTNDGLVMDASRSNESAMELLAARDAMVIRCLLAAINKTDLDKSSIVCGALSGFIRLVVARRSGIMAVMLKEGLEETDLDWMVENVPESMNDPQDYMSMLSERSALTVAERLVAADGIIRIAIVHGNSNEKEATKMLLAALSQLIDSFYLILGPVGDVPVNSVLGLDDGSADTIQVARKAAFRILKALNKLRGSRRKMKTEAGTALHKIVSLCKAESAASSGRRKNILKEIFDACIKAATSMGMSIGPQVAVA